MRRLLLACLALSAATLAQTVNPPPLRVLALAHPNVAQIGFSADGQFLLSASARPDEDGDLEYALQAWELASGANVATLAQEGQTLASFALHPSAPLMLTGSLQGQVTLWGLGQWAILNTVQAHDSLPRLRLSANGARFISYDAQGLLLWSTADFSPLAFIAPPADLPDPTITQAALSDDGARLAVVYGPADVLLYDASSGALVGRFNTQAQFEPYDVFFSQGGANLAMLYPFLEIRETASGMIVGQFSASSEISSAAVSRDWARMATGETEGRVLLWDIATQAAQRVLLEGAEVVWDVAFSPDGRTLAVARGAGLVELYGVE
jgi:WD40 repeat protein